MRLLHLRGRTMQRVVIALKVVSWWSLLATKLPKGARLDLHRKERTRKEQPAKLRLLPYNWSDEVC